MSPTSLVPVSVGQRVAFTLNRQEMVGTVGFAGETQFAAGKWVGIVLDAPNGKNDGSVRGEVYFKCPPAHGLFIRPQNVIQVLSGQDEAEGAGERSPSVADGTGGQPESPTRPPSAVLAATGGDSPSERFGRSPAAAEQDAAQLAAANQQVVALEATLRTEQEACAKYAEEQKEAEARLSACQEALRNAESAQAAQASAIAAQLSALRNQLEEATAARSDADELHRGTEEEIRTLRKELQEAQRAIEEARTSQGRAEEAARELARKESESRKEAQEQITGFLAESRKMREGMEAKDSIAAALQEAKEKELLALKEEMRREQETCRARIRELEAAAAAAESQRGALRESEALQSELRAERTVHLERLRALEAELQAESSGRQAAKRELEVARSEQQAAEVQLRTEQRSLSVQAEAAALAASSRELEALKAQHRATAELSQELRAKQQLVEELEDMRLKVARQQALEEQKSVGGHLFSAFCCGRASVPSLGSASGKKVSLKLSGAQPAAKSGVDDSTGGPEQTGAVA